jgi:hypothetical protein
MNIVRKKYAARIAEANELLKKHISETIQEANEHIDEINEYYRKGGTFTEDGSEYDPAHVPLMSVTVSQDENVKSNYTLQRATEGEHQGEIMDISTKEAILYGKKFNVYSQNVFDTDEVDPNIHQNVNTDRSWDADPGSDFNGEAYMSLGVPGEIDNTRFENNNP